MPFAFCIYGHLADLKPEELSACSMALAHYELSADGNILDFVHEGVFIDFDSDLEAILSLLGPHVRGVIDLINHQDWEMFRFILTNGTVQRTKVALDNALDSSYASERRS